MSSPTTKTSAAGLSQSEAEKREDVFTLARRGNILTLRFGGQRLGEREATLISPQARNAIDNLGAGLKGLVLDMTNVRVMSSYGLGLCIELRNLAMSHRAGTVLYGMCPDIRELFRVMKVDRLFTIALNSREAPKPTV